MTLPKDYTGQRYGRLVAIRRASSRGGAWVFLCDCGHQHVTDIGRVRFGMTQSCGCLRKDKTRERSITHGHAANRQVTGTLSSYRNAISRCTNPDSQAFPNYGGRGIKVCDRWLESFDNFFADMGFRPEGMSLERKENNGNYEPENCIWANALDQASNRRNTIPVEHNGRRISLRRFASEIGVGYHGLYVRVTRYQQDPHAAATAMIQRRRG